MNNEAKEPFLNKSNNEEQEIESSKPPKQIELAEKDLKGRSQIENEEILSNDIKETPNNDLIATELQEYSSFLLNLRSNQKKDDEKFQDYVKGIHNSAKNFIQTPIKTMETQFIADKEKKKEIRSIALSPDQSKLLVGCQDNYLYHFDITSENSKLKTFNMRKAIDAVAYSYSGDKILAACPGVVLVFNLNMDEIIKKKLTGKKNRIITAAFSVDGDSIIFGSDDGKLRIASLKINDEEEKYNEVITHEDGVCAFAYTTSLKKYATGGNDKLLNIFSLNQEGKATNIIKINKHKGIVRALVFSNDGKYLVSGSYDCTAKLFDSSTGRELMTYRGHQEAIYSVAISPDSRFILTGSQDNDAILFDRKTGSIACKYHNYGAGTDKKGFDIRAVTFLGDGSKLIIAGEEGIAKVFSIEENQYFRGHSRHHLSSNKPEDEPRINCLDIAKQLNRELIVTGADDCIVRLYDLETAFELKRFEGSEKPINAVKFSPDVKMILSGGEDYTLRLYDVFTGGMVCKFEHHRENIQSIVFSPNGNEFASGGEDKIVNIYNFFTREHIITLPSLNERQSHDILIRCMTYSPDGKWIIVGGYDTSDKCGVSVYSMDGNTKLAVEGIEEENMINDLVFINDQKLLAVSDKNTYLIDFKGFNDSNLYEIVSNSDELPENIEYRSIAKQVINGKCTILLIKTDSEISWIDSYDEELNLLKEEIYKTDNDLRITSKISFLEENKLCFGTNKGFVKIMEVIRDKENNPDELNEISFAELSDKVEILTFDESGSKVGLFSQSGLIIIMNIFSGRIQTSFSVDSILRSYEQSSKNQVKTEERKLGSKRNSKEESKEESNENNKEKSDKTNTNTLNCLRFSKVKDTIITGMEDGSFYVYNYEKEIQKVTAKKGPQNRKKMILLEYSFEEKIYVYCGYNDGSVMIHDIENDGTQADFSANGSQKNSQNKDGGGDNNDSLILLIPGKYKDKSLRNSSQLKRFINNLNNIFHKKTEQPQLKSVLYVLLKNGSLKRFDLDGLNETEILNKLKEPLTCACYSNDLTKIIMGGEDNLVRVYDFSDKGERIFKGHEDKICSVSFLSDVKYGVSASEDQVIKVFEIDSGREIFIHNMDVKIYKLCVSPKIDTLVLGTENGLHIIDRVLTPRRKIDFFTNLGVTLGDEKLAKDFDLASELKGDSFDLLPVNIDISILHLRIAYAKNQIDVLKEVADILTNRPEDPSAKIRIEPETKEFLCECIFRKDIANGKSPWMIWIETANENANKEQMIYEKLLDILLSPFMVYVDKMDNKAKFIEKIAQRCPGKLQEVLDVFWRESEPLTIRVHRMSIWMYIQYYWCCFLGIIDIFKLKQKYLKLIQLPIVLHTKSPMPCDRIMEKRFERESTRYLHHDYHNHEESYLNSYVKISKISLNEIVNMDFFDNFDNRNGDNNKNNKDQNTKPQKFLLDLFSNFQPEDPVFRSELLRTVINHLWSLPECIGFAFYRRLLVFFLLQILICLNCLHFIPERQASVDPDNQNPPDQSVKDFYVTISLICDSLIIFLLGLAFLARNIKLLSLYRYYGNLKYNTVFSLWNMLDYLIYMFGFVVFGFDIYWTSHMEGQTTSAIWTKGLLALFFATSWFKLIEFARGFTRTSALVRLLYQVTKDMLVYLLIIMFMVIGLAFAMFILQKSYVNNNLWHYFKITYGILIGNSGEFKDEKEALDSELYFIVLFFASVYLVIIMLNLLIAIINNSFGKVLEKEGPNEIFEKLKIINNRIYEFSSKEKQKLREKIVDDFLFQLQTTQVEQIDEEQIAKTKEIQAALVSLTKKQETFEKKIELQLKNINKGFEENLVSQISKLLDNKLNPGN